MELRQKNKQRSSAATTNRSSDISTLSDLPDRKGISKATVCCSLEGEITFATMRLKTGSKSFLVEEHTYAQVVEIL
eukprot:5211020-Amphidinium_carterae.1